MTKSDVEQFADQNPNPEEWKAFCIEIIEEYEEQLKMERLENAED